MALLSRLNRLQRITLYLVAAFFANLVLGQLLPNSQLQKDDLLAAFTDGITESEDAQQEQFGDDRLIAPLKANSRRPLDEILQLVLETVSNWAHDPSARDDITMLLARKR